MATRSQKKVISPINLILKIPNSDNFLIFSNFKIKDKLKKFSIITYKYKYVQNKVKLH
jgi:hypothetical protein